MSDELQAMCFFAGANSIFYGCKLLTTPNPEESDDMGLFRRLGLRPEQGAAAKLEEESAVLAKAAAYQDKSSAQFMTRVLCKNTEFMLFDAHRWITGQSCWS